MGRHDRRQQRLQHPQHEVDDATDRAIQSTSYDAVRAKAAAVAAGYYRDPFVDALFRRAATTSTGARAGGSFSGSLGQVQPIIKRGTHARVACMDRALVSFLNLFRRDGGVGDCGEDDRGAVPGVQVVVLGSGHDTTFFRLQAGMLLEGQQQPLEGNTPAVRWYEVDHEVIISEKASLIENLKEFGATRISATTATEDKAKDSGSTNNSYCPIQFCCSEEAMYPWRDEDSYTLLAHDLRVDTGQLRQKLVSSGFDDRLPTLFFVECVLMYLPESSSRDLLKSVCNFCINRNAYIVLYEPILGQDPFGKVMEKNLMHVGVADTGSCLLQTRTLQQQLRKLVDAGFATATGCDMNIAYETVMRPEQRRKANSCEFLDEVEEWMLIMRHYCLVVAAAAVASGGGDSDVSKGEKFCAVGHSSPIGFAKGRCESIR